LFGEHAAVFGYPAVGTALTHTLHLTAEPAARFSVEAVAPPGIHHPPWLSDVLDSFSRFLDRTLTAASPAHLTVSSQLPMSSGFGSSAALCTAIARWVLGREARQEVWRLAHELESFFHGTPSGIDTGLCSLGGVQAFHFNGRAGLPRADALDSALPALVVGSIPRERTTKELVAHVRRELTSAGAATQRRLEQLGRIAERAIGVLPESGDRESRDRRARRCAEELGRLADEAQAQLDGIGVSVPEIDRLLAVGRAAGACGGKLSGAGGGGAFYLPCATAGVAQRVAQAIDAALPEGGAVFTQIDGNADADRYDESPSSEATPTAPQPERLQSER
jgi:mevalonate kinase